MFWRFQNSSYLCIRKTRDMYPRETSGVLPEIKDGPFVYRLGRKIFILGRGSDPTGYIINKNQEQY